MGDSDPWGWLRNPYVWIAIIIVIAVIILSAIYCQYDQEEDEQKCTPPLQPTGIFFGIIWIILYLGLLIAGVLAIWRTAYSPAAVLIVFGSIMLYTLAWVITYTQTPNSWASLVLMLGIILFSMLFILLAQPAAINSTNAFVRKFPSIMICLFLVWVFIATYLNLGSLVLNSPVMAPLVGDCGKKNNAS